MSIYDRMGQALNEPQRQHPILSGLQFAHQTNEIPAEPDGVQGASLGTKTGRLLKAGVTDKWLVGSHPDDSGAAIPETLVKGRSITLKEGVNHVMRVAAATRNQPEDVAAGSWYNGKKGHIALDASTQVQDQGAAEGMMKARNEDAIFHLKSFTEVWNPNKKRTDG